MTDKKEEPKPEYITIVDIRKSNLTNKIFIVSQDYIMQTDFCNGGFYQEQSTELEFVNRKDLLFTIQKKKELSNNTIKEVGQLEKLLTGGKK